MRPFSNACCLLVGVVLFALPSAAQVTVGEDLQMHLNGDIGMNYNGSSSEASGSSHGLGLSGDANLTGSYYSPNFLSFAIQPYYGRTQNNSTFGTVTDASGVNANLNLFGGSHFPGSLNYFRGINTTGEFGVPGGVTGLASHGDNQGFGIAWSALIPGWPTLTASYAIGSGSSSIYGLQNESTQTNHNFTLRSTYMLDGFHLNAGFSHVTNDATFSELLESGLLPVTSNSSFNNYQVDAQHSFPMGGAFSVAWSHSDYNNSTGGISSSGASSSLNGNLAFHPANKLALSFNANYNDSLLGSLPQEFLTSGNAINVNSLGTFRSFLVGADANYQLLPNLGLHATVNHQAQEFLGQSYGATQFAANVNYNMTRRFLGSFSFSLGVFDSATKEGNSALGAVANVNFFRKVNNWDLNANVSYAQNVQTLLLVYTTSSFSWVSSASRRLGNRVRWIGAYSGGHSAISQQTGLTSSAERVSSTFIYHAYNINGYYSTSSGSALFTPTGLVPTPLPPSVLPANSWVVFNASAYGLNFGTTVKRLTVSAGYSESNGQNINPTLSVFTRTNLINGLVDYRLRKLYFRGGYTKLRQSVGTPGTVPVSVTTYYAGIYRWFNFF